MHHEEQPVSILTASFFDFRMFKKNWYLFTPLILVIIPAAIYVYYISGVGYEGGDAIKATQYFLVSGTRYPLNYDERNFMRLQPGMDGRQVFEMMRQQPFERHDGDTRWIYSLPKSGTRAYHERIVVMERDPKSLLRVKEVIRRFHAPQD